ncbi:hypothetical protein FRC18_001803 [Serendipita sp. 400]|nr:hypothetical protein FRC18_001803 [Serendipita sp. 400]
MQHPGHPQVPYYNTAIPQYPNQQPYFYSQPLASTSQRPTGAYTGPQRPVPFQSITAPQQSAPISSASTPKPPPTAEPPKSRKPPARKTYYEDKQIKVPDDAKIREHMKKSLVALVEEDTPGAKLEDDAAELLLHMANDFLNEVTNFSFRLAEHRLGEQQQGDDKQYVVTPEDMLLCLDIHQAAKLLDNPIVENQQWPEHHKNPRSPKLVHEDIRIPYHKKRQRKKS